ncbi:MAG: cyclic-di-AMP receptor [Chloroflexota bacterium]
MKLILAFVQDRDAPRLVSALTKRNFRATMLASTGGFLRRGNTTIASGIDDNDVSEWIKLAEIHCCERMEPVMYGHDPDLIPWYPPGLLEVPVGGAVIFVLNVERFEQL